MPNEAKTYYVGHVAPALIQHPRLSIGAKATAVALLMHENRATGYCYPTEEILSAELHVSERSVVRYLDELREQVGLKWEKRKAPRGQAKGRGNLYDLSGLRVLCEQPMLTAAEVTKATNPEPRGDNMSLREVTKTTPHASENRAITDNSRNIDSKSISSMAGSGEPDSLTDLDVGMELQAANERGEVTKTTPHPARIEQKAGEPRPRFYRLTAKQVQEQRLLPDGSSASEYADSEAYFVAARVVELAGGESFNPGRLGKLIDDYAPERVLFHARWYLYRLASKTEPVVKATPYFIDCVENDRPVNPKWTKLPERLPDRSSPELWKRWVCEHGGSIQDVPADVKEQTASLVIAHCIDEAA